MFQVSESMSAKLLPSFEALLKGIMEYLTTVTKSSETYQDKPTARFWKVYLHKVYDLVERVRHQA